jgi:hypothetical protein
MKPQPAPSVPGSTDWQRFDNAVRKVFSVPPEALQKEKERMKANKANKNRPQRIR